MYVVYDVLCSGHGDAGLRTIAPNTHGGLTLSGFTANRESPRIPLPFLTDRTFPSTQALTVLVSDSIVGRMEFCVRIFVLTV